MVEESLEFNEFMEVLQRREDPTYVEIEGVIPNMDWALRKDIYTSGQLLECSNKTTTDEFFICLSERRQIMREEIEN